MFPLKIGGEMKMEESKLDVPEAGDCSGEGAGDGSGDGSDGSGDGKDDGILMQSSVIELSRLGVMESSDEEDVSPTLGTREEELDDNAELDESVAVEVGGDGIIKLGEENEGCSLWRLADGGEKATPKEP